MTIWIPATLTEEPTEIPATSIEDSAQVMAISFQITATIYKSSAAMASTPSACSLQQRPATATARTKTVALKNVGRMG